MTTTIQSTKTAASISVKLRPAQPQGAPHASADGPTPPAAPADRRIARRCPGRRQRRVLAAAALITVLAAGPAAPAQAAPGGDATIEQTTINLAAGTTSGAVATCPAGRRVVGGGIGTTAATVGSVVLVNGPLDDSGTTADTGDGEVARHWYANVSDPGAARSYKVFALCAGDDLAARTRVPGRSRQRPGRGWAGWRRGRWQPGRRLGRG